MKISVRKPKRLLLLLAMFTLLALVAVCFVFLRPASVPPQVVTLPDGRAYLVAGVTWGTNHSQPRLIARAIDILPSGAAQYLRRKLAPRFGPLDPEITSEPALCLWFKTVGSFSNTVRMAPFNVPVFVKDDAGIPAGEIPASAYYGPSYTVFHPFTVVPRRSPTLHFQIEMPPITPAADIRVPNPLYGHFPQWTPEPLPATHLSNGVSLTLSHVELINGGLTGAPSNTIVHFSLNPSPHDGNAWMVHSIELSDATGNRILAPDFGYVEADFVHRFFGPDSLYNIHGSLWPSEHAVRVRFYLKHVVGYPASDVIIFTNVPLPKLGATSGTVLTQTVAGVPITIQNASLWSRNMDGPFIGNYFVQIQLPPPSSGVAVDFLQAATDGGEELASRGMYSRDFRVLGFDSIPVTARSLTIKLLVQKLQVFDFYVKPPTLLANQ